jgi:DNA-binding transcriptional LysR family regulator
MKHRVAELETTGADLADLRAFCMVADVGSITSAARALGETKGTVSRRLTRLERTLGVVLLRRSPRLVQTTEDGIAYRMRIGRALELLDEANAAVQRSRATPSGHLRITAPVDLGVLVAPLVAGFVERYPEVSVEVVLSQAVLDFDSNQIDLALRVVRTLSDSSLIAYKLKEIDNALYASPSYLRKHRQVKRPDDLTDHRMLVLRSTRGHLLLTLRANRGTETARVRVRAAVSASDFSFVRESALAGAGIALMPSVVATRDVEEGRLVPLLTDYAVDFGASFYLVHQGTRFLSSKIRVFRDYVLETFAVPARQGRSA